MKSYTISITLSINAESESEACEEAVGHIRNHADLFELLEVTKDFEFGTDGITFWLEQLPEPYRTKALRNYSKKGSLRKPACLASALNHAFIWRDTKEGFEFWLAVQDYCLFNSPLPEA